MCRSLPPGPMRPSHAVPGIGTLREVTLWKAVLLSIVTLGIYYLVLVYQNTRDIQEARTEPSGAWRVLFWVGVIPFLGFLHVVLYVLNGVGFREFLTRQNRRDDSLWIVALVLAVVLPPVGQVIWAVTFNDWLRLTGTPVDAPAPAVPPMALG